MVLAEASFAFVTILPLLTLINSVLGWPSLQRQAWYLPSPFLKSCGPLSLKQGVLESTHLSDQVLFISMFICMPSSQEKSHSQSKQGYQELGVNSEQL